MTIISKCIPGRQFSRGSTWLRQTNPFCPPPRRSSVSPQNGCWCRSCRTRHVALGPGGADRARAVEYEIKVRVVGQLPPDAGLQLFRTGTRPGLSPGVPGRGIRCCATVPPPRKNRRAWQRVRDIQPCGATCQVDPATTPVHHDRAGRFADVIGRRRDWSAG